MTGYYILEGHTPVPCADILMWAKLIESNDHVVACEFVFEHVQVSTVFMGIGFMIGKNKSPLLFESKVFGGDNDGFNRRYRTWDGAAAGHKSICEKLKSGAPLQ